MSLFFFDFRSGIHNDFNPLFEEVEQEEKEKGIKTDEESFGDKWGWYSIIYKLTGGEFLKMEEVIQRPLTECLTWLAFTKDIETIEQK